MRLIKQERSTPSFPTRDLYRSSIYLGSKRKGKICILTSTGEAKLAAKRGSTRAKENRQGRREKVYVVRKQTLYEYYSLSYEEESISYLSRQLRIHVRWPE
jgi:hypothetical protein